LPHAPVIDVLEVRCGQKTLQPHEYEITEHCHTQKVNIPLRGESRSVSIIYTSGFGDHPQEVPETLKQAVMSTVLYIYDNRYHLSGQVSPLYTNAQPWIDYHRSYLV